jgi:hypothetical protein
MQPMPGPPPPPPPLHGGWPAGGGLQPTTDSKAVVSLVLGILALIGTFCWLGLPLGLPAVIFGTLAHRDITRSGGMAGGRGMATAGIILGSIGSLLFVGWMGFMVFAVIKSPSSASAPLPPPAITAPTPAATTPPLIPPGGWGRVHVVDLHPGATPLRQQLADEGKSAKAAGETVLVETVTASCAACVEIARATRDAPMQAVLATVRLVHVDVGEFGPEAAKMGLRETALPWFYLLDVRGDPRDGVSADEWDDNDATEIAPVLDDFLHGRLRSRKRAWRGTAL